MVYLYRTVSATLLAAAVAGCATADSAGALQGQSGSLAWEVTQVRQTRQEDGREITWWFTLVLRNTGTSGIALERVTMGMMTPGDSWGGQSTAPFVQRVTAGDEIRLVNQTFTFHCQYCDPASAESVFRRGVVRLLQFEGKDDGGQSVRTLVRIRLDSSTGPVLK